MSTVFRIATLVVLIATVGAVASLGSWGQAQQWIAVVRDSQGRPIVDAIVTAVSASRTGAAINSTRTGVDGRFSLPLSRTPTKVTIWAEGYSPLMRGPITSGQTLETELRLAPGGEVVGSVISAVGIPATGVMLDIVYDSSRLPFTPTLDTESGARVTRSDGRFRLLSVMREVPFRLHVTRGPALLGRFGPYELGVTEGPLVLALTLPQPRVVYGMIDSGAGAPVRGATVRMVRSEPDLDFVSIRAPALIARSDDQGRFAFPPSMEGQFTLLASKDGYRPRRVSIEVGSANSTEANITMSRAPGF